jgi:hypothetical protein
MSLINFCFFLIRLGSFVGAILMLVALDSDNWLEKKIPVSASNQTVSASNKIPVSASNKIRISEYYESVVKAIGTNLQKNSTGLFLYCNAPAPSNKSSEATNECITNRYPSYVVMNVASDDVYPFVWSISYISLMIGLLFNVFACYPMHTCKWLALRRCTLFLLGATICDGIGLLVFAYGWNTDMVNSGYCSGQASSFHLGDFCSLGRGFWLAVAALVSSGLLSVFSFTVWMATPQTTNPQVNKLLSSQTTNV